MTVSNSGLTATTTVDRVNPQHDPARVLFRAGFTNKKFIPSDVKILDWNAPERKEKRESFQGDQVGTEVEANDVNVRQFIRDLFERDYSITDVHAYFLKEKYKTRYFLVVTFARACKRNLLSRECFCKIGQLLWLDAWKNVKYYRNSNGLYSVNLTCRLPNGHGKEGVGELCYAADKTDKNFEYERI